MEVHEIDGGGVRIVLPPATDATQAEALKTALGEALEKRFAPAIDTANVQRVSTPAIQLLVAAAREADRRDLPRPEFTEVSPAFRDAVMLVGAGAALGLSGD